MDPQLELTRLSSGCRLDDCPAGYLTNRGTFVFQGMVVSGARGLRLGAGEQAVEVPIDIVREALGALGS